MTTEPTEPLYKIQEFVTTGWEDILAEDGSVQNYSKEDCNKRLRMYLDTGIAPDRLRALRVA
tara:strand:- start:500 stop:685 length:186 start_codon:yes stop_codon:yes gene_type:complete